MEITLLYFAQLADLAGKTEETRHLTEESTDPATLYQALCEEYNFPLQFEQVQVAVNHQLARQATTLRNGDTIAFLPPMAGG